MPIAIHQLIQDHAGQPGYEIARGLARQCIAQFGAVRGAGVGIAGGSCCAALAVTPDPNAGFPAAKTFAGFAPPPQPGSNPVPIWRDALDYAVVYGNSRLAAGGLDLGPLGGHAERAALTAANGQTLYCPNEGNDAVLFVELTPCGGCHNWLNGNGGGVPNPFNGVINRGGPTTLNVWWRWVYPGAGLVNMRTFHQNDLHLQLAECTTW